MDFATPTWSGSDLELVVVYARQETPPLFGGEENRVLRRVVGVADCHAFVLDGNRHAVVDDAARIGETGLHELVVLNLKLEPFLHCGTPLCEIPQLRALVKLYAHYLIRQQKMLRLRPF